MQHPSYPGHGCIPELIEGKFGWKQCTLRQRPVRISETFGFLHQPFEFCPQRIFGDGCRQRPADCDEDKRVFLVSKFVPERARQDGHPGQGGNERGAPAHADRLVGRHQLALRKDPYHRARLFEERLRVPDRCDHLFRCVQVDAKSAAKPEEPVTPQVPLFLQDVEPLMQALSREQPRDETVPPIGVIGARHQGLFPVQSFKVFGTDQVDALEPPAQRHSDKDARKQDK